MRTPTLDIHVEEALLKAQELPTQPLLNLHTETTPSGQQRHGQLSEISVQDKVSLLHGEGYLGYETAENQNSTLENGLIDENTIWYPGLSLHLGSLFDSGGDVFPTTGIVVENNNENSVQYENSIEAEGWYSGYSDAYAQKNKLPSTFHEKEVDLGIKFSFAGEFFPNISSSSISPSFINPAVSNYSVPNLPVPGRPGDVTDSTISLTSLSDWPKTCANCGTYIAFLTKCNAEDKPICYTCDLDYTNDMGTNNAAEETMTGPFMQCRASSFQRETSSRHCNSMRPRSSWKSVSKRSIPEQKTSSYPSLRRTRTSFSSIQCILHFRWFLRHQDDKDGDHFLSLDKYSYLW